MEHSRHILPYYLRKGEEKNTVQTLVKNYLGSVRGEEALKKPVSELVC